MIHIYYRPHLLLPGMNGDKDVKPLENGIIRKKTSTEIMNPAGDNQKKTIELEILFTSWKAEYS